MAKIGSATAATTWIERSCDRTPEITWRTTAESSTIMTLMVAISGSPSWKRRHLQCLLDRDVAAPQVEHHVAVSVTPEILGGESETVSGHQLAPDLHVALGDIEVTARFSILSLVLKHAAAAEDLDLVFSRLGVGTPQFPHEHLHHFVGVAAVERLVLLPMSPVRRPVVCHAPGVRPWM